MSGRDIGDGAAHLSVRVFARNSLHRSSSQPFRVEGFGDAETRIGLLVDVETTGLYVSVASDAGKPVFRREILGSILALRAKMKIDFTPITSTDRAQKHQ